MTVTDPDPLVLTSATVSITSGFTQGRTRFPKPLHSPRCFGVLQRQYRRVDLHRLGFAGPVSDFARRRRLHQQRFEPELRTVSFVVSTGSLSSNVTGNNRFTKVINFSPATV